jgi:S-DNA-T family DNA segregation ATPase FtsK/SpoIIIE
MSKKTLNTLIAGVIGSGKSHLENLIIQAVRSRSDVQMVLIDPKHVELYEYKTDPTCLWYADEEEAIYDTLCKVYDLMNARYTTMQGAGLKDSQEPDVIVFVDEMAFLMQSRYKKEYVRMMNQITLLGRAAGIHLILCTQVSTQDVIPACIRDNMQNIVCLRQRDAGKYRYLLGEFPGRLPMIGYAYVFTPNTDKPVKMQTDKVWDAIHRRKEAA